MWCGIAFLLLWLIVSFEPEETTKWETGFPKDEQTVLTMNDGGDVSTGFVSNIDGYWYDEHGEQIPGTIEYFMYIPKKPKERS